MEFAIFILLLIILIVLLNFKSSINANVGELHKRMDHFSTLLVKLKQESQAKEKVVEQTSPSPVTRTEPKIDLPERPDVPEKIYERKETLTPEPKKEPEIIKVPEVITPPQPREVKPPPVQPIPPKPGFFERNPDLEKFIGENLANKIGIAVLVLGIGFFVKYAIDKEWIGIYGRVFIGILCGGMLIGVAHKLRKTFEAFSSVLVGGGIAVLYLTIYISFHTYGIMSQQVAFGIMVLITGFTVVLSLAYNRIELAILAILGGFGSPFMVSTGEGNYVVLFSYVMILDVGMLVLAFFKKWRPVNIIAYIFTILLFGSWLGARFNPEEVSMIAGGMTFASLFYVTFFVMNIINNLKQRVPFESAEFMILLSNTFLYYSAGMYVLNNPHSQMYQGLFTALVGVFNFIFAFILYRKSNVDKNLVFLLIGLVLTFISLAAPVQLEGNYITLFWAAEAVLLLWLSQKSDITLIKLASVVVMFLMWVSLAMDWYNVYYDNLFIDGYSLNIILNKGYITTVVALLSIILYFKFLLNESKFPQYVSICKILLTAVGLLILYVGNLLELTYHLNVNVEDAPARSVIIGVYNMAFILGLLLAEPKLVIPKELRAGFGALGLFAIAGYFLIYHREIISTRNHFLEETSSGLGFAFHYPFIILLIIVAAISLKKIRMWEKFNAETYNLYSWFFVFFFLFLASAELDHTVILSLKTDSESIDHILFQNHKIGFPILWGIASFILISIGLKRKKRHLRIISLSLFLITLLKLFLVDIRGISEGGKIAALISLGVLLLIVSFMYQRLKRLLMADEKIDELKQQS
jgi:uncharacterized membrane protein